MGLIGDRNELIAEHTNKQKLRFKREKNSFNVTCYNIIDSTLRIKLFIQQLNDRRGGVQSRKRGSSATNLA